MSGKAAPRAASGGKGGARSAARLAAVQALYQADVTSQKPETVSREFIEHRFQGEAELRLSDAKPDVDMFRDIVGGVYARREEIDVLIGQSLASGWSLERVHKVLRAVLSAGCYELIARPDVPTGAIINEYVEIAHAFVAAQEAAFANAVLDKIARLSRPGAAKEG